MADQESTSTDTGPETRCSDPAVSVPWKPTFRVYAVVVGLGVANLLAALENTVLTIAAPVVLTDLELGDNFVWILNAFFLCRYGTVCHLLLQPARC